MTGEHLLVSGIVGVIACCDEALHFRMLKVIPGRVEASKLLLGCVLLVMVVGPLALCLVIASSLMPVGLALSCVLLVSLMLWNVGYVLLAPGCLGDLWSFKATR